jgi:FkbM family methyltransferase
MSLLKTKEALYPEIFNEFDFIEGRIELELIHTRCGSVQSRKYDAVLNDDINFNDEECYNFYCKKEIQTDNDAIFEWLDICETVDCSNGRYTFVELGAGHARWSVIAYSIASKLRDISTKLIIVEAEPTHFEWAIDNLETNSINVKDHDLYEGAVDFSKKLVIFEIGDASKWYGQSISSMNALSIIWRKLKCWYYKNIKSTSRELYDPELKIVRTYTLNSILSNIDIVDLIHLDIQGKEFDVLNSSIDILNNKVKRLHIGTHSIEIEENLRELFSGNDWHCLRNYNCNSVNDTPFGEIRFEDGIQTWLNPAI